MEGDGGWEAGFDEEGGFELMRILSRDGDSLGGFLILVFFGSGVGGMGFLLRERERTTVGRGLMSFIPSRLFFSCFNCWRLMLCIEQCWHPVFIPVRFSPEMGLCSLRVHVHIAHIKAESDLRTTLNRTSSFRRIESSGLATVS